MADIYKVFQRTPVRTSASATSLVPDRHMVRDVPRRISYDEARDNAYHDPRTFESVINNMMAVLE